MAMQEWAQCVQWAQLARNYRERARQWRADGFPVSAQTLERYAKRLERRLRLRADALLSPA